MLLLSLKNDWQPLLFESGRCENSFVDYKINYEKPCYSLRKIWTDPLHINITLCHNFGKNMMILILALWALLCKLYSPLRIDVMSMRILCQAGLNRAHHCQFVRIYARDYKKAQSKRLRSSRGAAWRHVHSQSGIIFRLPVFLSYIIPLLSFSGFTIPLLRPSRNAVDTTNIIWS